MRILIAEDEKDLNTLLKKRLENQKYSVDACFDGRRPSITWLSRNTTR